MQSWSLRLSRQSRVRVDRQQADRVRQDVFIAILSSRRHDCSLQLGAVVHKLIGHKNAIVSVSFTTDCNMAITGKELFLHWSMTTTRLLCPASQDGLLSAWSTLTGVHLATFHFNQNLVKLLVAPTGGRIIRYRSAAAFIWCSQDGMRPSCKVFRVWRCSVYSIFHQVMLCARINVSSQVSHDGSINGLAPSLLSSAR